MSPSKFIAVYSSETEKYQKSFETFLKYTNQKNQTKKKLDKLIKTLPKRNVFIDVGAGNGEITSRYNGRSSELEFAQTIAIEPNSNLCQKLRLNCPNTQIIPQSIEQVNLSTLADFIVCSHVFYYVYKSAWLSRLEKLVSWLNNDGLLVLILQNYKSDCMKMIYKFIGKYYNLIALKDRFAKSHPQQYDVTMDFVEATVNVPNFEEAYTIAEFMLNNFTIPKPPPLRRDLQDYLQQNCLNKEGIYRLSCHQDFLIIRKLPSAK